MEIPSEKSFLKETETKDFSQVFKAEKPKKSTFNGWLLFLREQKEKITLTKEQHANYSVYMGGLWKGLTKTERDEYNRRAKEIVEVQ